jgi:hypothetical protein
VLKTRHQPQLTQNEINLKKAYTQWFSAMMQHFAPHSQPYSIFGAYPINLAFPTQISQCEQLSVDAAAEQSPYGKVKSVGV